MNTLQAEYEEKYGEGNYIPPVKTTFGVSELWLDLVAYSFLLSLYRPILSDRSGTIENKPWYSKLLVATLFFPFIANSAGWIMSEIGRQPWIVNGLMKTADSISPNVSAGSNFIFTCFILTVYTF